MFYEKIEKGFIVIIILTLLVIIGLIYINKQNYNNFVSKCSYIKGIIDINNLYTCKKGLETYIFKNGGFYIYNN